MQWDELIFLRIEQLEFNWRLKKIADQWFIFQKKGKVCVDTTQSAKWEMTRVDADKSVLLQVPDIHESSHTITCEKCAISVDQYRTTVPKWIPNIYKTASFPWRFDDYWRLYSLFFRNVLTDGERKNKTKKNEQPNEICQHSTVSQAAQPHLMYSQSPFGVGGERNSEWGETRAYILVQNVTELAARKIASFCKHTGLPT